MALPQLTPPSPPPAPPQLREPQDPDVGIWVSQPLAWPASVYSDQHLWAMQRASLGTLLTLYPSSNCSQSTAAVLMQTMCQETAAAGAAEPPEGWASTAEGLPRDNPVSPGVAAQLPSLVQLPLLLLIGTPVCPRDCLLGWVTSSSSSLPLLAPLPLTHRDARKARGSSPAASPDPGSLSATRHSFCTVPRSHSLHPFSSDISTSLNIWLLKLPTS